MDESTKEGRFDAIAFALLAVVAYVIFCEYLQWNFDDSYIVYRIVDNIISGAGWVYNPGERYNASTSVLNTVLITVIGFFIRDIPVSAHLLGSAAIFSAGLLLYKLISLEYPRPYALASGLLLAGVLSQNRTWGLEPNLFFALSLLFVWLEVRNKNSWFLLGFVFLARPDGILFFGLKVCLELFRNRKLPILGMLQTFLVVLPWLVFSLVYFGQLMPETLGNKIWQGQSGFWGTGAIYLGGLISHISSFGNAVYIFLPLAVVGVADRVWRRSPILYLLSFVALQQIFYVVINVPPYHWYFATLDAVLLIACIYGLMAVLKVVSAHRRINRHSLSYLVLSFTLLFAVERYLDVREIELVDGRDLSYKQLSDHINQSGIPDGALSALEVGTIGYHQNRQIIDMVSLTSKNPEFITGRNLDSFFEMAPKIVVLHIPVWGMERALFYDARFSNIYALGGVVEGAVPTRYYVRKFDSPARLREELEKENDNTGSQLDRNAANFSSAQRCVLDKVNGTEVGESRLFVWSRTDGEDISFEGWMIDPTIDTQPAISFALSSADYGNFISFDTVSVDRADVVGAFDNKAYMTSGFIARAHLSNVSEGLYQLAAYHKETNQFCNLNVDLQLTQ